jgi:hypothetical protein
VPPDPYEPPWAPEGKINTSGPNSVASAGERPARQTPRRTAFQTKAQPLGLAEMTAFTNNEA